MTVRWKGKDGRVRELTAAEFRGVFGVDYSAGLIAPPDLPADFLRQCAALPTGPAPGAEAPTYIARINERIGWGLFAARDLRPGQSVGEYAGVLSQDWRPGVKTAAGINPYLLKFPFKSPYAIDAARCGNATRFVNHSSKNQNIRREHFFRDGLPRVVFIVDRPIRKGDQVLIDYGGTYWLGRAPLEM